MTHVDEQFNGGKWFPRVSMDGPSTGETSESTQEPPGRRIGPYVLSGVLGEGGYGIVYLAEQRRSLKRRVTLKLIKPDIDSQHVTAQFEAER